MVFFQTLSSKYYFIVSSNWLLPSSCPSRRDASDLLSRGHVPRDRLVLARARLPAERVVASVHVHSARVRPHPVQRPHLEEFRSRFHERPVHSSRRRRRSHGGSAKPRKNFLFLRRHEYHAFVLPPCDHRGEYAGRFAQPAPVSGQQLEVEYF